MGGQKPANSKYHPQDPNHRKNLTSLANQKMEPSNSTVPKIIETNEPITVLHAAHTRVRVEAGQGQAAAPPPYASPLVYTMQGKDHHPGLRCPQRWLSRGPHQGLPVLSFRLPPPPLVMPSAKRPRATARPPGTSGV